MEYTNNDCFQHFISFVSLILSCIVLLGIIFRLYSLHIMYTYEIYCFLYACLLFYTYILQYVHFWGGAYKYLFPAEELRVSVLSVQCVASTCVSVGMG